MDGNTGHSRPFRVVVEPSRKPATPARSRLGSAFTRAVIDALADSLIDLLPFPLSFLTKLVLNLLHLV